MKDEIRDILRDILRRGDDVLGTTPETDLNYLFLHTLVNYARAKQESEGALTRLREVISIETQKPLNQVDEGQIRVRFVNLLQTKSQPLASPSHGLSGCRRFQAETASAMIRSADHFGNVAFNFGATIA
jgi:hypothetical protein